MKRLDAFIKEEKFTQIYVPKVYHPLTKKLLIMEFIDGNHIDEIDKMKNQNIDLKFIGSIFSKLVIKMIHKKGFVHADLHAGNLKVRMDKNGKSQLVVLDHGLYQDLTTDLKHKYNEFWLGLILNDEKIFGPAARQLGAKNPHLLCSMLTSKSQ